MNKETGIGLIMSTISILLTLGLRNADMSIKCFGIIGIAILIINCIVWILLRRRIDKREAKEREERYKKLSEQYYWEDDPWADDDWYDFH